MRNIEKRLTDIFFQIGNGFNIAEPKDLNKYKYKHESDEEALKSIWEEVGKDIDSAMRNYKGKK